MQTLITARARNIFFGLFSQFVFVTAHATDLAVNINTSPLLGTHAEIAFDLISGDGSVPNQVNIANITTDGTITAGTATLSGAATGDLTTNATLLNTGFFSEILQPITLGNTISLTADVSQNLDPLATIPDAFSIFLLDNNGNNLFATTDPTGANSLVFFNIDGTASGNLNVYTATADTNNPINWTVSTVVPLPSGSLLFISGLSGLFLRNTKRKK